MKKIQKILLFIILYLYILTNNKYAKYSFEYSLNCYDIIIKKDQESPEYKIMYSTNAWTNKDVLVKIKFSEEIKGINGFKYNNGYYEKYCTQNEYNKLNVYDLAGNETLVEYHVKNIDKIPPIINGIENLKTYNSTQQANYIDKESGIKNIEKIYYGDLLLESKEAFYSTASKNGIDVNLNSVKLNIIRAPKNIIKYKFYRVDLDKQIFIESIFPQILYKNTSKKAYNYYAIGIDNNGKMYKSNILKRKGTYFKNIILNKDNNIANIFIVGLEKEISKIGYNISSIESNNVKSGEMINNNLKIDKKDFNNSEKYKILLKFYTKEKLVDERNLFINLNENYTEEDDYTFSKPGNYDIKITDNAGNETLYTIIIKE